MQILIDKPASTLVRDLKAKSKERKLKAKHWTNIFSKALLEIPDATWERLISAETSAEFYIHKALSGKDNREELIKFMRKLEMQEKKHVKKATQESLGEKSEVQDAVQ